MSLDMFFGDKPKEKPKAKPSVSFSCQKCGSQEIKATRTSRDAEGREFMGIKCSKCGAKLKVPLRLWEKTFKAQARNTS